MNKLKRKAVYEAPLTEFFQVELEGGFMVASANVNSGVDKDQAVIEDHGVNTGFNSNNFAGSENSTMGGWETF